MASNISMPPCPALAFLPLQAHHAAASCPNMPAACDWPNFSSPNANPQVGRAELLLHHSCNALSAPCAHAGTVMPDGHLGAVRA